MNVSAVFDKNKSQPEGKYFALIYEPWYVGFFFLSGKGVISKRSMVCCIRKLKFHHCLNADIKISLCQ